MHLSQEWLLRIFGGPWKAGAAGALVLLGCAAVAWLAEGPQRKKEFVKCAGNCGRDGVWITLDDKVWCMECRLGVRHGS